MKYNTYVKRHTPIFEIGFGAWQLGINSGWKNLEEREAIYLVEKAFDLGVNFYDTAPVYGNGTGELRLGKALKKVNRNAVVINSKFGRLVDGTVDFNAKHIKSTIEGSLKRMGLDYLDSVIIHSPPISYLDGTKNDHYNILERLKEEGKILAYGASIESCAEIDLLLTTTQSTILHAFFNIFHQNILQASSIIREKEAVVVAKIPLDSGWLTGKYTKKSVFTGVRNRWSKEEIGVRAELVNKLETIVGPDQNLAQVALAFCLSHDLISCVIPGSISKEQLLCNVSSAEKKLSETLVKQLHNFYETEVAPLQLPW